MREAEVLVTFCLAMMLALAGLGFLPFLDFLVLISSSSSSTSAFTSLSESDSSTSVLPSSLQAGGAYSSPLLPDSSSSISIGSVAFESFDSWCSDQ